MEKAKKAIFVLVTMLIMVCSSVAAMAASSLYCSVNFNSCGIGDSAEIGYCNDRSATYQWYRTTSKSTSDTSDWVEISGATGKTYTYSEDDTGYYIGLIVSGGVGTAYEGSNVVKCSSSIISRTFSVSIAASNSYKFPGCTLTASVSPDVASEQVSYKWYRSSTYCSTVSTIKSKATLIAEGTDSYTTNMSDAGCYIYAIAEGTGDYDGISNYARTSITEPYLTVRISKSKNNNANDGNDGDDDLDPGVDDLDPGVDDLDPGVDDLDPGVYDDLDPELREEDDDLDPEVDYDIELLGSDDLDLWNSDPCPGTVLTASTTAAGQEVDSVSYQWYVGRSSSISGATEISGANTNTYTVQDSDVYKYVFVKATGTGDYADYKSGSTYTQISESGSTDTGIDTFYADLECSSTYVGNTATVTLYPEDATVTYTWYRDDEVITGATDSTYTFTDDDIGAKIYVLIVGTDDYSGWNSLAVGTIKKNFSLTVSTNGLALTAVTDPEDATVTYQWQVRNSSNVYEDIEGATSSSYIGAYGNTYKVVVTGTGNYTGIERSVTKTISSASLDIKTSELGTSTVGTELSLDVSVPYGTMIYGTDYTVEWGVSSSFTGNYELIEGATGTTYTVTENEAGKFVHALFNGLGNYSGLYWDIIYYPDIKLSSDRSAGSTVTVSINSELTYTYNGKLKTNYIDGISWAVFDDESKYTTRVEYESNTGLTNNSYTLTKEDAGQHLQVYVYGKQAGNKILQNQCLAEADTYITATKPFTASFKTSRTEVGDIPTVVTDPEDATVTYTWYRDDEEITGATDNAYTLTSDDVGTEISVKVVGTGDYEGEVNLVLGTITANTGSKAFTTKSSCTSTQVGGTATLTHDPYYATVAYTWYRDGEVITGATSNSYTFTDDDVDKKISVSYKGTGDFSNGLRGFISFGTITAIKEQKTFTAKLVGTKEVGGTIEVVLNPEDATAAYVWERDGKTIAGATGNSYTFTAEDAGSKITLFVSGTGDYNGTIMFLTAGIIDAKIEETSTEVGDTVSVATYPEDATATYTWYRDNEVITGSTASTYTLTDDDVDTEISVAVAGTGNYSGKTALKVGRVTAKKANTDTGTSNTDSSNTTNSSSTTSTVKNPTTSTSSFETDEKGDDDFNKEVYESGSKGNVDVYVSQSSMFTITIPKKVTLDGQTGNGSYKVTANYDIPSNQALVVEPAIKEIKLSTTGKKDIKATIAQEKTTFSISEDGQDGVMNNRDAEGTIKATNVTAGVWTGSFNFNIKVEGSTVSDSTANNNSTGVTL